MVAVVLAAVLTACSSGDPSPTPTATSHGRGAGPSPTQTDPAAVATAAASGHAHASDHPRPSGTPSAEQQRAADELVRATREAMEPFEDIGFAASSGYFQGMPYTFDQIRAAHYFSVDALVDGGTLDPERPEGLIYLRTAGGEDVLLGVMYIAMHGPGPEIGGPLTAWHAHPELCISGFAVQPILASGECVDGAWRVFEDMIHVWSVPNPAGPFAHLLPAEAAAEITGQSEADVAPIPIVAERPMGAAVATALELSPARVSQRFDGGETLDEMATSEGIAIGAVTDAVSEVYTADVDAAVADGELTRELADEVIRFLAAQVPLLLATRPGDPAAQPSVTTDFGYPCVDTGCLIE